MSDEKNGRLDDAYRYGGKRLSETLDKYPAMEYETDGIILKYVTCAVTAAIEPLERMTSLCLSGQYPIDLYNNLQNSA